MKNNIYEVQNNTENIEYLLAQNYLYSVAKKIRIIRVTPVLFIALIVMPIILLFFIEYRLHLIFLSAFLIILNIVLYHFEKIYIINAAKIQELFDTGILNLNWNNILIGKKPTYETISHASEKFNGIKDNFINRYSDVSLLSKEFSIIICQRSNLYWDYKLRNYFSFLLGIFIFLIIIIDISLAMFFNLTTPLFIIALFLPSITAIALLFTDIKEHLDIVSSKKELKSIIDAFIEDDIKTPRIEDLRMIQDKIYILRIKGALVPDLFYNTFRKKFEENMIKGNDYYIKKIAGK